MIWIVLSLAVFNIMMAMIMRTKDTQSAMVFKVIPFFLGLGSLIYSLQEMGVIK